MVHNSTLVQELDKSTSASPPLIGELISQSINRTKKQARDNAIDACNLS